MGGSWARRPSHMKNEKFMEKLKERRDREMFRNTIDPLMAMAIQMKYERLIEILQNRSQG
jgi:hypothetical protein